jgi:2,3-bisphosphoglycerate-independent phosphoglycerate mutase
MKYLVILGDGMADHPVPELKGRTPLDVARHPHMDRIAQQGSFGLARTVPQGMTPGSDTANLSVFGYDPRKYYSGRSPLEAASMGIRLGDQDVAYRCNFVTLPETGSLEDALMCDYSAGEISSQEAKQLVDALNEALADDHARLYAGVSYRQCFVLSPGETGAQLSQPHDLSGRPVRGHLPTGANAALLRRWMEQARAILIEHPVNLARRQRGQNPANAIWFWGEGRRPMLQNFCEKTGLDGAVISAVDLVQGIGLCAGMRVIQVAGATGTYRTNYAAKAVAAIEAFKSGCDYVYLHLEGPDECGHQHQVQEKIYAIEQIDGQILSPTLAYLEACGDSFCVLLMPDHPTPLTLMTHTAEPVPFVLYKKGDQNNRSCRYTESDAAASGVFIEDGHSLIDRMLGR